MPPRTTISTYESTKTRFDTVKPDGLSADQFLLTLLDAYDEGDSSVSNEDVLLAIQQIPDETVTQLRESQY